MKLYVYVAFNQFLECSGQPKFDDHTPDVFASSFKRRLMTAEDEKVFQFENVSWYQIGEYDDETMKFEALKEPLLLLRCSEILDIRKIKAKMLEAASKKEDGDLNG